MIYYRKNSFKHEIRFYTYMYLLHNRSLTSDMHRDDKTEQVSMVIVQYLPFYIKPNLEGKKQ